MREQMDNRGEAGFTLIEILTTIAIASVLMTLGAVALRHFWLNRSIAASKDGLISQMRSTQEKVVSESWPYVYGLRFDPQNDRWWMIRYDPVNAGPADDTCTVTETHTLEPGVVVDSASFAADPLITDFCKSRLGANPDDAIALFYSRGSATEGSVTLRQTALGKTRTIEVDGITGRVSD